MTRGCATSLRPLVMAALVCLALATAMLGCMAPSPTAPETVASGSTVSGVQALDTPVQDNPPVAGVQLPTAATQARTAPTATATLTASVEVSSSAPVSGTEFVALVNLNIREGASAEQPVIGWLLAGAKVIALAASGDGAWLQIVCPAGIAAPACWVTSDPALVQRMPATEATTPPARSMAAQRATATAAATATATTVACAPGSPPGWGAHRVQAGDTLYDIALRTGVSVAELLAVNCLDSDVILEGAALMAPPGAAIAPVVAPVTAGASNATGAWSDLSGVRSINASTAPANGECLPPSPAALNAATSPTVIIGAGASTPKIDWEITEMVCVYILGLQGGDQTEVALDASAKSTPVLASARQRYARWRILLKPGERLGEHTIDVRVNGMPVGDAHQINVMRSAHPRLRVVSNDLQIGEPVELWFAGLPEGLLQFFFFRLQDTLTADAQYHAVRAITPRIPVHDPRGEGILTAETLGLAPGRYAIDTAAHFGGDEIKVIAPHVFVLN